MSLSVLNIIVYIRLYRLSTLGSNGTWPASEIDYTAGCNARRANWPAQEHWARISMSYCPAQKLSDVN